MKIYHIYSFFLYSLEKVLYNKTEDKSDKNIKNIFKI